MRLRSRIRRTSKGQYTLRISAEERALVANLLPQMRELLTIGDGADDEAMYRLFPPAYADDEEREKEYRSMIDDDLLRTRLRSLDTIEVTLDAREVDEDQLNQWMSAINDIRLVLGTRLDISEDLDPDTIRPTHPDAAAYALYAYLSHLLGEIVEALADW